MANNNAHGRSERPQYSSAEETAIRHPAAPVQAICASYTKACFPPPVLPKKLLCVHLCPPVLGQSEPLFAQR